MVRVARLHAAGDLRLHDEPDRGQPPRGWSRLAVTSVGICGSDLHWFTEGGIGEVGLARPLVPGHEFAGVALDGPLSGRRVAVDPAIPCGECVVCRRGDGNLCPRVRFAGHGDLDGALQQEIAWPSRLLHPLPDDISDDAGALLEPLGVAMHALKVAHMGRGDDVLVVGAGPIGVLVCAVARAMGSRRLVVSEPIRHRRETARRYGADEVVDPDDVPRDSIDVVIEVAGTDDAVTAAVHAARPGARVALAGIPSTPRSSFPAAEARRKGLTFAMVRRMHETYPRALEFARAGVDLDGLVSDHYDLEDAAQGFATAGCRRGDKVIVHVGR